MKSKKPQALPPAQLSGTAIEKPLSEDQERQANVFRDGQARSMLLPRCKDGTLEGTAHGLGAILDLCKTDHYNAAIKVVENATVVRANGDPDKCLNMALQQIEAIKPQSYLESLLVSQMLQVNEGISKCMGLAFMKDQTTYGKELNANLATKLQRTFVAQIEALQKLRGKGGQKVTVEHVHVYEGGQAIVGNVNHAPGGRGKGGN